MSGYIPFSEEKAAELAAAYEISPKTVRVWRFRGRIPARYDAGFLPSRPAARKDTLRVIEVCQLPAINAAAFTSIGYRKIVDVTRHNLRGKRASKNFTAAEVLAFRQEITRLRNKLRLFLNTGSEATLKDVIADMRIKHYVLFADHKRMLGRLCHKLSAYEHELEECRVLVARLYSLLKF